MRRRPLHPPSSGTRLALALVAVSLLAAAVPGSAAADDTPPIVSYTIDGITGTNSWYRGSTHGNNIVVRWSVTDPESPITSTTGCSVADKVDGPNTGTTRTCSATSDGGTVQITTKLLKIDADPPAGVAASPSRAPDFNGWYNHAVGINWGGSDPTSGLAGCSSTTYGGPDAASAAVSGGCTDMAGNSTVVPIQLNYDATAPVLRNVSVLSNPDDDVVRWTSSSAADTIVVQRWARGNKGQPVVFRGTGTRFRDRKIQDGIEYSYAVQATDQAGNVSTKVTVAGLPRVLTLKKMRYVPRAAAKPILRWEARRGASYYHVQLFRGGRRILAVWPAMNELGLPAAWKWAGHRYRLGPGKYRWYVWAGLGKRSFARYKTIGSARFIVPKR